MKILFLHSLAESELGGGAEITLWSLMRGLRDAGHKCVLLATSNESGLKHTESEGITVWTAGIFNVYWPFNKKRPAAPFRFIWHTLDSYNPWMQAYIRKIVTEEKPDVASLHNLPGWSAASWVTLTRLGVPLVQVLHDYHLICVKATMHKHGRNCTGQCGICNMFRMPHRALSRSLQAIVAVSYFVLKRHRALGYFEDVPIQRVIHNARSPKSLGVNQLFISNPHSCFRVGYIGRLDAAKGVELLIQAFLSADLPNAELWIAGSGMQNYEAQLRKRVSNPRVRFLGRVAPGDFYPQVDVVVVPSLLNDNLPGVLFESLAFGKPVIGSRRGGIPEMLREGENGLLFEPNSPGELVNALRRIHDDEILRAHLAANACLSSRPFMDLPTWVDTYQSLFREMTEQKPMPHASISV